VPGSPRVIHAPGHTAGSCVLFLGDRSVLFSGDALATLDCTYGRTGPQIIRGPFTEDAELALASLDVLAGRMRRSCCRATANPGRTALGAQWTSPATRVAAGP